MRWLTDIVTGIFTLVIAPLPALLGLTICSALTAVFILLVYRLLSNQGAISRNKQRIFGHFLEIYLYRDSSAMIVKSLGRVLGSIGCYLAFFLPPLLVVFIPVTFMLAQLDLHYGHALPPVGTPFLLRAQIEPGADRFLETIALETGAGLEALTPVLRIAGLGEADWRIERTGSGPQTAILRGKEAEIRASLDREGPNSPIYPVLTKDVFPETILRPGQDYLPADGPVDRVIFELPSRSLNCGLFSLHWAAIYFVLTIALAFAFKKSFKVEF